MKLVEMKCKNCGANLEVEEGQNIVECPYCNVTYKIDDEAQHIKYENMENSGYEFEKGRLKAQKEHLNNKYNNLSEDVIKKSKIAVIISTIIFAIIFIMVVSTIIRTTSIRSQIFKTKQDIVNSNIQKTVN